MVKSERPYWRRPRKNEISLRNGSELGTVVMRTSSRPFLSSLYLTKSIHSVYVVWQFGGGSREWEATDRQQGPIQPEQQRQVHLGKYMRVNERPLPLCPARSPPPSSGRLALPPSSRQRRDALIVVDGNGGHFSLREGTGKQGKQGRGDREVRDMPIRRMSG